MAAHWEPVDAYPSTLGRSPPSTAYRSPPTRSLGYASTMHHYGGTGAAGTPRERELMIQVMQKDSKIRVSWTPPRGRVIQNLTIANFRVVSIPQAGFLFGEIQKNPFPILFLSARARRERITPQYFNERKRTVTYTRGHLPKVIELTANTTLSRFPSNLSRLFRRRSKVSSRSARVFWRARKHPWSRFRTTLLARRRPRTRCGLGLSLIHI